MDPFIKVSIYLQSSQFEDLLTYSTVHLNPSINKTNQILQNSISFLIREVNRDSIRQLLKRFMQNFIGHDERILQVFVRASP